MVGGLFRENPTAVLHCRGRCLCKTPRDSPNPLYVGFRAVHNPKGISMAPRLKQAKIDSLAPDNRNFNKGTEYGEHLMDESIRRFGLGRSILIDKNNRIIAGNKTFEKAGELGFEKVVVVETDGKSLVAVKRTDVDLDTPMGRELALADNATGKANLSWDIEAIKEAAEAFDFDPGDWGVSLEMQNPNGDGSEDGAEKAHTTRLIVESDDLSRLSTLFDELQNRGFSVSLKE